MRATLDRHPAVLLHLARLYDGAALFEKRSAVLDRLDGIARSSGDDQLRAALEVERITDLMRSSQYAVGRRSARRDFLARDDGVDAVTRGASAVGARAGHLLADR